MYFVIRKKVIFLIFIYMVQFCTGISVTPCIYISVWGNRCGTHLSYLELESKKIVRAMAFASRYEHTPPLFQNSSILNIKKVNKYMEPS